MSERARLNLYHALVLNVLLAVFDMLPVPPLDGGRIAVEILPRSLGDRLAGLESYGMFVPIMLLFVLPAAADNLGVHVPFAELFVAAPVAFLIDVVTTLTGVV